MIALLGITAALPLALAPVEDGSFVESVVDVPQRGVVLALRDMDGDGARDLVQVDAAGIGVRYLGADGRLAEEIAPRLGWPARHLAWDLTDLDGDGCFEIAMLLDGREVRVWRAGADRAFGEDELLLEARAYLPRGLSQMDFARDVDGDGREDLVLPGSGEYSIRLRRGAGWSDPFAVSFEATIEHEVGDPDSLTSRFGQTVDIPWFRVEDVDGDGRLDLVSETTERVDFHIAAPEVSGRPTWSLDLARLREELPAPGRLDLADLFSALGGIVSWRVLDVDGVAPSDLVLQTGSTFKVYLGAARSGPSRTPDQVLKSSGTTLTFFLRDVQADPLPELQLLRVEKLTLARALRWLILPGRLDFDVYTYRNEGGVFSRKPTRRNGVVLKIPRLLSFLEDIDEVTDELERQAEIPARAFDLDGDGRRNDVVDLQLSQLRIFRDVVPEDHEGTPDLQDAEPDVWIEELLLADLDRLDDGGIRTIDLGELDEWDLTPGAELRALCRGRTPDHALPAAPPGPDAHLHSLDLDGDGRADLVVIREPWAGRRTLRLLVQRD